MLKLILILFINFRRTMFVSSSSYRSEEGNRETYNLDVMRFLRLINGLNSVKHKTDPENQCLSFTQQ